MKEIKVKLGDKVSEGSVIVALEVAGEAASAAPAPAPAAAAPAPAPTSPVASVVAAAPAATAAPAASGPVEVRVPDIGDFKDVAVIEVLVKVGDTVKAEQSLITVESDKASMEIPSAAAGVVKELRVKLGDKVNIGDVVLVLEGAVGAVAVAAVASAPAALATPSAPVSVSAPALASSAAAPAALAVPAHNPTALAVGVAHASPSVRKFARELGVPLSEVKGSGPKGRITQTDVQQFTASVMAGAVQTLAQAAKAPAAGAGAGGITGGGELNLLPWPKVDFAKFGPIERKEMSRIR